MKKIELLVPAGNFEAFRAAVFNGADAVYIGGKNFGARAFANNFDHEELIQAVKLAHLYGVKVYVTMNTMLYEDEIEPALKEALFLHTIGVDALIVQDLGFTYECLKRYPNLELHASTQMHVHNLEGAVNIVECGLSRVVVARETPLDIVKSITRKGIDVEIFAHGALCISYSGQCLMSSVLFNRSGNRGTCAQCCRLQYKLHNDDNNCDVKLEDKYLLSPKDLNLLDSIPELIESGVSSIKIEGRMKRKEYVGLITRLYRQAIDAYYEKHEFKVTDRMINDMKLLFNRGFTHGHLFSADSKDIYNQHTPNHIGIPVGKTLYSSKNQIFIKLDSDINQGDGLRVNTGDKEIGIIANKIYKNDLLVNSAKRGDIIAFDINDKIVSGLDVLKTTDIKLNKEINEYPIYRKVGVDVTYKAISNDKFSITISDGVNTVFKEGDIILEKAQNRPTSKERIEEQITKINDTAFKINTINGITDDVFIPIKHINEIRRQVFAELANIRENNKKEVVIYPTSIPDITNIPDEKVLFTEVNSQDIVDLLKDYSDRVMIATRDYDLAISNDIYYISPNINENSLYNNYKKTVISECGGLKMGGIAGYNLNIANSYSVEFLYTKGFKKILLSSELNEIETKKLMDMFFKRHSFSPDVYSYVYGKRDLMYIKKSFISKELGVDERYNYSLVDIKGRKFKIDINRQGITQIKENDTVINKNDYNSRYYFIFNDMDTNQVKSIISKFL